MGLRELFTNADLNEITPSNDTLYISDIVHQAYIVVNESGTEATAVTAMLSANCASSEKKIHFVANHPFIYYIRYTKSNTILFVGHYY